MNHCLAPRHAIRPALAAALLVLTALVAAPPAHAQDADGNVFHDGDSLPGESRTTACASSRSTAT